MQSVQEGLLLDSSYMHENYINSTIFDHIEVF
jgi:hypothetical protein